LTHDLAQLLLPLAVLQFHQTQAPDADVLAFAGLSAAGCDGPVYPAHVAAAAL
jgi:hypothetical protein